MPRLGVLGTMVWDTIFAHGAGDESPHEDWGGIAYALSAFDAVAPADWRMYPIVKVGADLAEPAHRFLADLVRVDSLDGVQIVPEPNNRVALHYHDTSRRCERLSGGIPPWEPEELWSLARECDALYVNFIAGWEMDLAAARGLRDSVGGPIYADLHSLLLSAGPDGIRALRPLAEWREWLACFDVVQLNEEEFEVLTGQDEDQTRLIAGAVGPDTQAVLVTLGARGASWIATESCRRQGLGAGAGEAPGPDPLATGFAGNPVGTQEGDPTGCGDVWGLTCCASLLDGLGLEEAMQRANSFAARAVASTGTSGLRRVLRSETGVVQSERQTGSGEVSE
jgi:hypothetical protein